MRTARIPNPMTITIRVEVPADTDKRHLETVCQQQLQPRLIKEFGRGSAVEVIASA